MESDITESALFYKLWAWGEKNKKQLIWGAVTVVVVGLGIAFWLAHQNEKQNDANDALSKLTGEAVLPTATPPSPESLLKVTADYPDTDAGQRALLLGAADLFAAGKFDEAQARFQQFIKDYNESPLMSQAAFGVAACYDALGKARDAISAYQSVVDRYPNQNVTPQAKLALGRLLEGQGKYPEARSNLQEVLRSTQGTLASEAASRLQELNALHPESLESTNRPAAPAMPVLNPKP
ncbi:MAG TPA: tetratricopeptide repeat protein [Verrucomicrobiae bacterium]|jgi:TolA-binding protein|nr:tetratricopeptide repeat protein [Verrucomicrobiae bacterium]